MPGLEPGTSSLPRMCATSCATSAYKQKRPRGFIEPFCNKFYYTKPGYYFQCFFNLKSIILCVEFLIKKINVLEWKLVFAKEKCYKFSSIMLMYWLTFSCVTISNGIICSFSTGILALIEVIYSYIASACLIALWYTVPSTRLSRTA